MPKKQPTTEETKKVSQNATVGRPSSISEEQKALLIDMAGRGYTRATCYKVLEIEDNSFDRLMKNREFRKKFEAAERQFLQRVQDQVLASATTSVTGAQWLLERRAGDEFKSKQVVAAESDGKPIRVTIKNYTVKS